MTLNSGLLIQFSLYIVIICANGVPDEQLLCRQCAYHEVAAQSEEYQWGLCRVTGRGLVIMIVKIIYFDLNPISRLWGKSVFFLHW